MSGTSLVGCANRGVELRADFTVEVTHADKPLPGVSVEIKGGQESAKQLYSELTSADGRVRFKKLPPGEYWINVELLGIGAGYECFHINSSPSSKAKKRRRYEWGDLPVGVRQVAGRFVDSKPGSEGTPIQRIIHRVDLPLAGAQLELHQPFDGTVHRTVTDSTGYFLFDKIPAGIYVLHIVASPSVESASDFLIRISDGAKPGTILLRKNDASAGERGGTSLQTEVNSSPGS